MEELGWLYFIIAIAIFFICRELICWYWKQNEQVELLKDIRHLLEQQLNIIDPTGASKKIITGGKKCWSCGIENSSSNTNCISCGNKLKP